MHQNRFFDNESGGDVGSGQNISIDNNTFARHDGPAILFDNANGIRIRNNIFAWVAAPQEYDIGCVTVEASSQAAAHPAQTAARLGLGGRLGGCRGIVGLIVL